MKKLNLLLVVFLLVAFAVFDSCSNNIGTILDDYNSKFTIVELDVSSPSPGDDDFVESEMLFNEYYVSSEDTLNLAAPYNCNSYRWVLIDPEQVYDEQVGPTEIDVVMFGDKDRVSREFVTYIPDSGLKIGKTYKLTLYVTDKGGNEYKDACGIIIYRHFDF